MNFFLLFFWHTMNYKFESHPENRNTFTKREKKGGGIWEKRGGYPHHISGSWLAGMQPKSEKSIYLLPRLFNFNLRFFTSSEMFHFLVIQNHDEVVLKIFNLLKKIFLFWKKEFRNIFYIIFHFIESEYKWKDEQLTRL